MEEDLTMARTTQTEISTKPAAPPLPIIDAPPPPKAQATAPVVDDRPPPADPEATPTESPNAPPPEPKVEAKAETPSGEAPKDGEAKVVKPVTPVIPMGFEPENWDEMWRYARWLANTSFVPDVVQGKVNDVAFMLMKGKKLGLNVMQSASLYVIDGKICMPAETMLSIILRSPFCKYMRPTKSTMDLAEWSTLRAGDDQLPVTMDYTIEEARSMGLLDKGRDPSRNQWNKQRRNMLRWRGLTTIGRLVFPDVTGGFYSHEEVVDMIEMRGGEVVIEPLTRSTVDNAKDGTPIEGTNLILPASTAHPDDAAMLAAIAKPTPQREMEPARRSTTAGRVADRAAAARAQTVTETFACSQCQGPIAKPGTCDACK